MELTVMMDGKFRGRAKLAILLIDEDDLFTGLALRMSLQSIGSQG